MLSKNKSSKNEPDFSWCRRRREAPTVIKGVYNCDNSTVGNGVCWVIKMRTQTARNYCALVFALMSGLFPALAQPKLGILRANDQSILYWPSNATGYTLQRSEE